MKLLLFVFSLRIIILFIVIFLLVTVAFDFDDVIDDIFYKLDEWLHFRKE